jgi:hypothetical protein
VTTDLDVPDAAVEAFRRYCSQVVPLEEFSIAERVRAIAIPVVIAELMKLCPGDYITKRDVEYRIDQITPRRSPSGVSGCE